MIKNWEVERAKFIKSKVEEIDKNRLSKFESYIEKMPAYIQNNGLLNTLLFYKSKTKGSKDEAYAYKKILEIVDEWIRLKFYPNEEKIEVIKIIQESNDIRKILLIQKEILALITWMKLIVRGRKSENNSQ